MTSLRFSSANNSGCANMCSRLDPGQCEKTQRPLNPLTATQMSFYLDQASVWKDAGSEGSERGRGETPSACSLFCGFLMRALLLKKGGGYGTSVTLPLVLTKLPWIKKVWEKLLSTSNQLPPFSSGGDLKTAWPRTQDREFQDLSDNAHPSHSNVFLQIPFLTQPMRATEKGHLFIWHMRF